MIYKNTDLEKAILYNPAMLCSVKKPTEREAFVKTVKQTGFKSAENKYLRESLKRKIKKLLSKAKQKLFRRK